MGTLAGIARVPMMDAVPVLGTAGVPPPLSLGDICALIEGDRIISVIGVLAGIRLSVNIFLFFSPYFINIHLFLLM
jgi:hypothetical protein